TPEAACVRFADRIAYLTHDVLDALRAGVLRPDDLPDRVRATLGPPGSRWISTLIHGVLDHSAAIGEVAMDPQLLPVMDELRDFMFARVYRSPAQLQHQQTAARVVTDLVGHLLDHPELIPASYTDPDADLLTRVGD